MFHRLIPLMESRFALDGGAMFGIIPKPLWEKTNPADDFNRIRMAARCLLAVSDERVVLIDAGMGDKWSPRDRDIYAVQGCAGGLEAALSAVGYSPSDITDVVVTHLHFDHAGGLTRQTESGELYAAFPGATHWIQRENWTWAHHPTPRDAGSYRTENFRILGSSDGAPIEFVDGPAALFPGLRVDPMHGHTPGMQLVHIDTPGQHTVFVADLFPTRGHVQPVWVMGYDLQPLVAMREKQAFLEEALRNQWVLAFEHDPDDAFATVRFDGKRWHADKLSPVNAPQTSP
jgi:glyoxylase-like metal-dependent hydrolase (beta-lactamase superfamily II)